jgi:RNA recognition motif-containing protein
MFEEGTVDRVNLVTDRETGSASGFGFVEMRDEEGERAIAALNGREHDGRMRNLSETWPKEARAWATVDSTGTQATFGRTAGGKLKGRSDRCPSGTNNLSI